MSKAKPAFVTYVSVDKVAVPFNILVKGEEIRGVWLSRGGKVAFEVPAELEEGFKLHWHCQVGNVVKAEQAAAEQKPAQ
jgi:hypothetical protein